MPVSNMCILGVSKELIPSIKGFHFPASFCLWFSPYFSALGESVFLLLITKLDFNLPARLHSFHKWVSLCLKAEDREKIMGILFTLFWLQRPPFPIPQAREKYFLWEVEVSAWLLPWQECILMTKAPFSRLKRGKKRRIFSYILSGPQRPTFLCPLAKNCWLLLDIFLFISALQFKDSGGAQVSARKIEGTKKQEMRCLMSHSLSSDFPQSTYFLTSWSSQIDSTHILFRFFHCNLWERVCLLHISSMGRLNCVFK